MRLIDADELKEWMANWLKMDRYYHPYASCNDIPINELEDIIERMPTVDAVPGIRCRDCKRWNTIFDRNKAEFGLCQTRSQLEATRYDEYCSRAERKEE